MIDHKIQRNVDYASVEIWRRLSEIERESVLGKFPDAKDLYDSRVKSYLVDHYKDKLVEVVIK